MDCWKRDSLRAFARRARSERFLIASGLLCGVIATVQCNHAGPSTVLPGAQILRVGVAGFGTTGIGGLKPLIQNLSVEGLVGVTNTGRTEPRMATALTVSDDHLSMIVHLRSGMTFHD